MLELKDSDRPGFSKKLTVTGDQWTAGEIKMDMIKRFDIAHDYDYPPRTKLGEHWYNPEWYVDSSVDFRESVDFHFRNDAVAFEQMLRHTEKVDRLSSW